MTPEETKKILDQLRAGRQNIDVFDEIAFRKVTADHTMTRVVSAIAELRTRAPFVNPSDLRDELEKDGSDEVWPAVSALITAGALRQRLDPEAFPSDRAYRACRSIVPQLQTGTPHSNAKAFAAAYKRTPAEAPNDTPALAAATPAEVGGNVVALPTPDQRRALAAARAAIPDRDTGDDTA